MSRGGGTKIRVILEEIQICNHRLFGKMNDLTEYLSILLFLLLNKKKEDFCYLIQSKTPDTTRMNLISVKKLNSKFFFRDY